MTQSSRLELPAELSSTHNIFHVSQLKKCVADNTSVVLLEDITVDEGLNYVEKRVSILDRRMRESQNMKTSLVKVQWQP